MERYVVRAPLFKNLPKHELKQIAHVCELRRFRKGESIFQEGQPAAFVWIVEHGWVYLVKRTPQGRLATIFTMTPDEAICGISAFDHGTYSAGAVAATDSQLIKIPSAAFSSLVERYPKFATQVLSTCCNRIRHMAEAISVAQAPVEQRLTYVLLRLRATFGRTIPVTHDELARMAGTRWETSIRTVSILKRRGWLSTSRGKVRILRPDQLKASLTPRDLPNVRSGTAP